MAAPQQIPDPNARPFRLSLETISRKGFERDAGEPLADFVHRHGSSPDSGIVNDRAAPADPGEHNEVAMVPMQDARQPQPLQMRQVGAQRASGEPHRRGDPNQIMQGSPADRYII